MARGRKRKRLAKGRQHGWSAGMTLYRYGVIKIDGEEHSIKSRISLAGGKPLTAIFVGKKREALIDKVLDEMRDWRATPLENEADMRHGLRSALCLTGHTWPRSDAEAASLVGTALRRLGAVRPDHNEGQREYTGRREQCARCGVELIGPQTFTGYRFCSEECARLTLDQRDFYRRDHTDRLYSAAKRMIMREKIPAQNCAWCGTQFHPEKATRKQACCSRRCASLLRMLTQPLAMHMTESVTVTCVFCGDRFSTLSAKAIFCSNACSRMVEKMRGGHQPEQLKRHVFDHFFTVPVNDEIRCRMTPQKFDWMMMESGLRITAEARMPRFYGSPNVGRGHYPKIRQ